MSGSVWSALGEFFVGVGVAIYDAVSRKKAEPPAKVAEPQHAPGWSGIEADENAALARKRATTPPASAPHPDVARQPTSGAPTAPTPKSPT